MLIQGKAALLPILLFMGLLASLFGAQLIHEGEYEDVEYKIYLDKFSKSGDTIKSKVRIIVTNNRDSKLVITNIKVQLYDIDAQNPFLTITNIGKIIETGETETFYLNIECSYGAIPENSLRVSFTAFVSWDFTLGQWISEDIIVKIEVEL